MDQKHVENLVSLVKWKQSIGEGPREDDLMLLIQQKERKKISQKEETEA